MSFNSRYAKEEKKTFTPPEGVQSAARKALKWIEEGHAGGGFTSVGRGRAHQLANGESVSLSTIKRMHSYFSRHRVDKQGKDWNKPSPGKVAWYAWGGDAGAAWAKSIAEKHSDTKKESSFDERYTFEKTAHDPGILQPILHGLSQIGHGVGNAVKDLAHQMVQPVTHRFTGDPNHLKGLWDQANAIGGQHDPNGVAQENAMNAWEQYGQGHTKYDYHLPGIGADLGAAGTFGYGLYRLLHPQASTFTYNSKEANFNERYAHDSFHFWPEDIHELIDHLSDHHHGQFKEIVGQLNGMIDSSLSGNNISQDNREAIISKVLKEHLTDLSSSGAVEPKQMLAEHDYVHNRTDGPDRGYDLITKQNPDQVEATRKSLGHNHTEIPEF